MTSSGEKQPSPANETETSRSEALISAGAPGLILLGARQAV